MNLEWREVKGTDKEGDKVHLFFLCELDSERVVGYVDTPANPTEFAYHAVSYGETPTRRYMTLEAAMARLQYVAQEEDRRDAESIMEKIKASPVLTESQKDGIL